MTSPVKLRVWHVISNRWNSAVTEYALSCAASCRLLGWENVFSPLTESPCERRARKSGFEVYPFKGFGIGALPHFFKTFRSLRPTHVFVYGGPEATLSLSLPDKVRLIRFRGQDRDMKKEPTLLGRSLSHLRVDALLLPNDLLEERFRQLTSVKTASIPLGCDAALFKPTGEWKNRKTHEVLCVGRLDPVKGHQRLFHIFSRAKDMVGSSMKLRIIGESANISVAEIHGMANGANLIAGSDYVLQHERVADLGRWMERATLGMIPSLDSEVICRVGEEFLLCGTPICVSGAGALTELIFPGAGASYAQMNDIEAARVLARLFQESLKEDQEKREARSREARRRFSFEAMAASLEGFVSELS